MIISPYAEPRDLKNFLPLMTKEEMEELLQMIFDLLRMETDNANIMRLMDNRDLLEEAIDRY